MSKWSENGFFSMASELYKREKKGINSHQWLFRCLPLDLLLLCLSRKFISSIVVSWTKNSFVNGASSKILVASKSFFFETFVCVTRNTQTGWQKRDSTKSESSSLNWKPNNARSWPWLLTIANFQLWKYSSLKNINSKSFQNFQYFWSENVHVLLILGH